MPLVRDAGTHTNFQSFGSGVQTDRKGFKLPTLDLDWTPGVQKGPNHPKSVQTFWCIALWCSQWGSNCQRMVQIVHFGPRLDPKGQKGSKLPPVSPNHFTSFWRTQFLRMFQEQHTQFCMGAVSHMLENHSSSGSKTCPQVGCKPKLPLLKWKLLLECVPFCWNCWPCKWCKWQVKQCACPFWRACNHRKRVGDGTMHCDIPMSEWKCHEDGEGGWWHWCLHSDISSSTFFLLSRCRATRTSLHRQGRCIRTPRTSTSKQSPWQTMDLHLSLSMTIKWQSTGNGSPMLQFPGLSWTKWQLMSSGLHSALPLLRTSGLWSSLSSTTSGLGCAGGRLSSTKPMWHQVLMIICAAMPSQAWSIQHETTS